jgi:7,8-dihydropterin-6-yl-methyl-4-(beta-D-ribofuranosyl)aminobenzene 5'-phosphate synthase
MIDRLRVTVLVENSVYAADLLAEHGVAFLVEAAGRRILFDTGQGRALLHNARELGIPLSHLDAIVLSHGHFDHTGALADVLALPGEPAVYLHPAALDKRYTRRTAPPHREIGMPDRGREAVERARGRAVWTTQPAEIAPGILVTGEIPRAAAFEDTGGKFYRDPDCAAADPIPDDQALVIDFAAGAVVVLGCAHAGVVNTLEYARLLSGRRPVHAVLGGMHLANASEERLSETEKVFRDYTGAKLGPCHCTGIQAVWRLRERFAGRVMDCFTGAVLTFESQSGKGDPCH